MSSTNGVNREWFGQNRDEDYEIYRGRESDVNDAVYSLVILFNVDVNAALNLTPDPEKEKQTKITMFVAEFVKGMAKLVCRTGF